MASMLYDIYHGDVRITKRRFNAPLQIGDEIIMHLWKDKILGPEYRSTSIQKIGAVKDIEHISGDSIEHIISKVYLTSLDIREGYHFQVAKTESDHPEDFYKFSLVAGDVDLGTYGFTAPIRTGDSITIIESNNVFELGKAQSSYMILPEEDNVIIIPYNEELKII